MSPLAPGAHPSPEEVDVLLDLPEGASDDLGERSVATHVAGCPACQEVASSLRAVRDLLREEGRRTPPVPDDLPGRLDAALARAGAERAGTVVPIGAARTSRGVAAGEGRQLPRWVGIAAGLAVLGGAAIASTQVLGGGGDSGTFTSADSAGGGAEADEGASAAAARSTGTEYTRKQLPAQVGALLAGAPRAATLSGEGLASGEEGGEAATPEAVPDAATLPDAGEPLVDPAGLQGCLEAIDAPGVQPLAVDLATFEGEEAAVLVLPGSSDDQVEVWVVARDCRPGADGLKEFQRVTVP